MKLIAGPMATLSHEAFRHLAEDFGGADEYYTEMINASSLLNMGPFEKFYLINETAPEKIVWQITGNNAESMAKAASVLNDLGGIGIDINMGCSAPQIYKTGAGISWMTKPLSETRDCVKKIKDSISKDKRLSVKCRLGKDDFTETEFFNFAEMLVKEGVMLITLHPRTIKEKLRGLPRYEYAEKLSRHFGNDITVYVNGEIKDKNSFKIAMQKCPSVNGFMIARAAASRPWIFDELKGGHKTVNRKETALNFIDYVTKAQPEEFWKTRMQRFFSYYCTQFKFGHYFQSRMLNYRDMETAVNEINDYFSKQQEEIYLEY